MPFTFVKTPLEGLLIIEPRLFPDDRGFFMEAYKKSDFSSAGVTEVFVQDNHSYSSKGVLRGLHFQKPPYAQGKLLRVVKGAAWDVAVDIRSGSATYMKWFALELNEENHKLFYIPPGFAHGYYTLTDETHFLYKCTFEYMPEADCGISWKDPDIGIEWPVPDGEKPIVSDKDASLPYLKDSM